MNWFERYGIVGIYYVIFSFGWLTAFSHNLFTPDKAQIVIAIGAGISLPIGYLLSIFSQYMYYSLPEKFQPKKWQVHKTVCGKIHPDYDEKRLESNFVITQRLNKNVLLENNKWLQDYVRKRWDVFAINSSLIVATFLAWIPAILLSVIQSSLKLDNILILILVFLSVIIIHILWRSRCLMFDLIVDVHTNSYALKLHDSSQNHDES